LRINDGGYGGARLWGTVQMMAIKEHKFGKCSRLLRVKQADYPLSFSQNVTGDIQSTLYDPSQDSTSGDKTGRALPDPVRDDLPVETLEANCMNLN
jgi:hypothetical protein